MGRELCAIVKKTIIYLQTANYFFHITASNVLAYNNFHKFYYFHYIITLHAVLPKRILSSASKI